jgi:putative ABC transport system substrate-binding protein
MIAALRRRDFITLLGGAVGWPLAAQAQQPAKLLTIGFLGYSAPSAASAWVAAFVQRLHELGWVENRDIAIEYRWAEGRIDRLDEIATAFVGLNVKVIVTYGTPGALAAKRATSKIPIVFALVGDPVGTGVVTTLARPGANITGLSNETIDLLGKRLELLRELVFDLRRIAILGNSSNPSSALEMAGLQSLARSLGLEATAFEIRRTEEITPAFEALTGRMDALYVSTDMLVLTNRVRINTLALGAKLPTMHGARQYVEAGGLMSYGTNYTTQFRRAADYVDKILHGTKPSDIPVEQPTKFELVVNLTTAKALGLTIPESFLLRADEVIE